MFGFLKKMIGQDVPWEELKARKAVIVDVRTPAEFKSGHVKGAINIPLNNLPHNIRKIKKYGKPVVTCCASGRRSGMAAKYLKSEGIEAWNGGPWQKVRQQMG